MYNLNSLVDEILYTPIDDSTIHFVRCQYIVGHTYRQLIAGIDIFCKYFKECTIAIPGTGVCHCVFACIRWIPFVFAIPGKMSSTLFRVFFFFYYDAMIAMARWSMVGCVSENPWQNTNFVFLMKTPGYRIRLHKTAFLRRHSLIDFNWIAFDWATNLNGTFGNERGSPPLTLTHSHTLAQELESVINLSNVGSQLSQHS